MQLILFASATEIFLAHTGAIQIRLLLLLLLAVIYSVTVICLVCCSSSGWSLKSGCVVAGTDMMTLQEAPAER